MKAGNKLVCGVGMNDVGNININEYEKKWYSVWRSMLRRCYNKKSLATCTTYIGCTVSEEWKTASNFKKWFDLNYIVGYQLDKDILVDGNKVYSPETCRFIPMFINYLFLDSGKARGLYPLGVYLNRRVNRFVARMKVGNKNKVAKSLGYYSTPELAYQAYPVAKKAYCKEVADEYFANGSITEEIRDAIYKKADNLK